MKKFLASVSVILALSLSLCAVSCKKDDGKADDTTSVENEQQETTAAENSGNADAQNTSKVDGMTLPEIFETVYSGFEEDELPILGQMEITKDTSGYYLGVENLEFKEALASEAMINAVPHSVCLVRFEDGTDIEAMKKDIKENADPRKWICVSVEPEKVIVDSIGNVVILIMDNDVGEHLHDNFLSLAK